jgi:hypothetical protein
MVEGVGVIAYVRDVILNEAKALLNQVLIFWTSIRSDSGDPLL